ncbi:lipopolysaccharide biosynthesis protein [Algoriella sp.]|uniref:lipopolysaccharide biosynthesis protein n=1 Tax=Algoriella sp. TaxID=1872434 RepID=UPI002FC72695
MKEFYTFIKQFLQNNGLNVFISIFLSKFAMLINTIFIVKMIDQEEFGRITLIASVLSFFTPWNGIGSLQMFMKYGSELDSVDDKNQLGQHLFWKGLMNQLIVSVLFVCVCFIYTLKFEHLFWIIFFFTIRLFGYYFLTHITIDFRIKGNNKKFAEINNITNVVGLIITFVLTYFYGALGYVISLAIGPFLSFIYLKTYHFQQSILTKKYDFKAMWSYGRLESFAYFSSELLFAIDIAMIAYFMTEKDIALYKVAILLPLNLIFLPTILIQTDFPKLIKHSKDKNYLKFYLKNYYRIFIPIGCAILIGSYFLKEFILQLFFSKVYIKGDEIFFISACAVVLALWFRVLYLNLFSVIGYAKWNSIISALSIVVLIISDMLLIPKYHLEGAAVGLAITFTFSGILAFFVFYSYLRKL